MRFYLSLTFSLLSRALAVLTVRRVLIWVCIRVRVGVGVGMQQQIGVCLA